MAALPSEMTAAIDNDDYTPCIQMSNRQGIMDSEESSTTMVIKCPRAKPEEEQKYIEWLHRVHDQIKNFEGFVNMVSLPRGRQYVVLIDFTSRKAEAAWHDSKERKSLFEELQTILPVHASTLSVDSLPSDHVIEVAREKIPLPPPKWKLFLLTWVCVASTVMLHAKLGTFGYLMKNLGGSFSGSTFVLLVATVPWLSYCMVPLLQDMPWVAQWVTAKWPKCPCKCLDEGLTIFRPSQHIHKLEQCVASLQNEIGRINAERFVNHEHHGTKVEYLAELLETGGITGKGAEDPASLKQAERLLVSQRTGRLDALIEADKVEWNVMWSKNWEEAFEKEFARAIQYAGSPERLNIVDCQGRDLDFFLGDYDKVEFFDIPEAALFPLAIRLRVLFAASLDDLKPDTDLAVIPATIGVNGQAIPVDDQNAAASAGEVETSNTVQVCYLVRWGCQTRFVQLIAKFRRAMNQYQDFVAINVLREKWCSPSHLGDQLYTVVFRFASKDGLNQWNSSAQRQRLLLELQELVHAKPKVTIEDAVFLQEGQIDLEAAAHDAFSLLYVQAPEAVRPPVWKVTGLTILALLFLVWPINQNFTEPLVKQGVPLWGRVLITTAMSVFLNTFVAVPLLIFFFGEWLSSRDRRPGVDSPLPLRLADAGLPGWKSRLGLFVVYVVPLIIVAASVDIRLDV